MAMLRIAPLKSTGADVLEKLQLERRGTPAVGTCDVMGLLQSRPVQRISFPSACGPARGVHSISASNIAPPCAVCAGA